MFEGINLEDEDADEDAVPPPVKKIGFTFRKPIQPYICSTPLDFKEERNFLAEKIYPNLIQFAKKRGAFFSPIDVQWSPQSNLFTSGQLLRFSLENISKCSPFFICLLGLCYGPYSKESLQIQHKKSTTYDVTLKENNISADAAGYHWVLHESRNSCSITELEIIHAAFLGDAQHCHFYFRQSDHLQDKLGMVTSELEKKRLRKVYLEGDLHGGLKMSDLKRRIVKKGLSVKYFRTLEELGNMVLNDWTGIIDLLYPLVKPFFHVDTGIYQEWLTQESFAENRREMYLDAPEIDSVMQQLSDFALTALDEITPDISETNYKKYKAAAIFGCDRSIHAEPVKYKSILCLTGDRGAGKSTIIAQWLQDFQDMNPSIKLIYHFVGSSFHSTNIILFLTRCITELRRNFLKSDEWEMEESLFYSNEDEPANFQELCEAFISAISLCPCVLVIDALDELGGTVNLLAQTVKEFKWLPAKLPPHCKIITSMTRSDLVYRSMRRRRDVMFVATPVNSSMERKKELLSYYMGYNFNCMDVNHFRLLNDIKVSTKPLFMTALACEMRCYSLLDDLETFLEDNLEICSVRQFWEKSMLRWVTQYSWVTETNLSEEMYYNEYEFAGWIADVLCLIALSRNGLTQVDIFQLLKDSGYVGDLEVSIVDWLQFRSCIGFALYDKADGLICFSHQHIKEIVQFILLKCVKTIPGEIVLADDNDNRGLIEKRKVHEKLAKHFEKQPHSQRRLEELPWQLMMSGNVFLLLEFLENWEYIVDLLDRNNTYPSNKQDFLFYWEFLKHHGITADRQYYDMFVKMGLLRPDYQLFQGNRDTCTPSMVKVDMISPADLEDDLKQHQSLKKPPGSVIVSEYKTDSTEDIGIEDNLFFITEGPNKAPSVLITEQGEVSGGSDLPTVTSLAWHVSLFLLDLGFTESTEKILSALIDLLQKNYPLAQQEHVILAKAFEVNGNIYNTSGKYEQAETNYRESLKIVVDLMDIDDELICNPELNYIKSRLLGRRGSLCLNDGELDSAEEFLKEALEYIDDTLKSIPLASTILFNLGILRLKQGKLHRAESVFRQSLALREQWFGKSHPLVADVLKNLAKLLSTREYKGADILQAEHLYRRAIEIREDHLGSNHLLVAELLNDLGCLIGDASTMSAKNESINVLTQALDIRTSRLGGANTETKRTQKALTNQEIMLRLGNYEFGHAKPTDTRSKSNPFSSLTTREKDLKKSHLATELKVHEVLNIRSFSREELIRHNRPLSFIGSSSSYLSTSEKPVIDGDRLLHRNSIERKLKSTFDQEQNGESSPPVARSQLTVDMNFVADSTMEEPVVSVSGDTQKDQLIESFATEDSMVQDRPTRPKTVVRSRINSRPDKDPFKMFRRYASAGSTRSGVSKMSSISKISSASKMSSASKPSSSKMSSASMFGRSKTPTGWMTPASSVGKPGSAKSHTSHCEVPDAYSLHVSDQQSIIGPHSCITSLLDARPLPRDMKLVKHHQSAWYHVPGRYPTPEQFYPSKRSQARPKTLVTSYSQSKFAHHSSGICRSTTLNPSKVNFLVAGQSDLLLRYDSHCKSLSRSTQSANEKRCLRQNEIGSNYSSNVKFQETVSVG